MKKAFIFLVLQTSVFLVLGQQQPVNPQKDKMDFEGYIIKIIPSQGAGYGYDIFKENYLVVHQSINPFTMSPIGLDKKEDAYKVAKWQVQKFSRYNHNLPIPGNTQNQKGSEEPAFTPMPGNAVTQYNQSIPQKVAKELNIQLYPSYTPSN